MRTGRNYAIERLRRLLVRRVLLARPRAVDLLAPRALVAVVVRRPPRRLVELAPIPIFWPRDDVPWRLRLADFMRLVAITYPLSPLGWLSSRCKLRGGDARNIRDPIVTRRKRIAGCIAWGDTEG